MLKLEFKLRFPWPHVSLSFIVITGCLRLGFTQESMQLLCIRLLESLKSVVLVSGEGRCCHSTWQTTRRCRVKARGRVPEKPDVFYNDLLTNQPIQPSGTHYEQSIHSCQWPSHLLKVPSANTMALGTKPQHESC